MTSHCPSRPPSRPAGDSGCSSGPEAHPEAPTSGEREDLCSDNPQRPAGPWATRFPLQPLTPSLTRCLWAFRSSCRNSRRAPRTASGSRSEDAGEVAGPGDGGSDPGLRSKGLGLLSPSPLPRGGGMLRGAGAQASPAWKGPAGSSYTTSPTLPHPAARMSFPLHTGSLTLLLNPFQAPRPSE